MSQMVLMALRSHFYLNIIFAFCALELWWLERVRNKPSFSILARSILVIDSFWTFHRKPGPRAVIYGLQIAFIRRFLSPFPNPTKPYQKRTSYRMSQITLLDYFAWESQRLHWCWWTYVHDFIMILKYWWQNHLRWWLFSSCLPHWSPTTI